jgi:hypothetical protein
MRRILTDRPAVSACTWVSQRKTPRGSELKEAVAKTRSWEHERAARPLAGEEYAKEYEIQPSPKDAIGRAR